MERSKAEMRLALEAAANRAKITIPPRRRNPLRTLAHILGISTCLLAMAVGTLFGQFFWGSETIRGILGRNWREIAVGAIKLDPLAVYNHDRQFPGRNHINILVLGIDYDYDNKAQIIKTAHGRSDAILVARIDFYNKRIDALTIPRDTAVRLPGRTGISKVNAAHANGGPELAVQTISETFQIPIDAYCVINFDGFKKIVDAIGGIDINVEKRLKYDDNWGRLHVDLHPGYQKLTGEQAMGYVRIRKSDSDFHRSKRQHAFLEAVRTKLKSPSTFMRLPKVVDSLNDMLKKGFISEDQMFALANFARTLPKDSIHLETLPSIEGPSYVTCNDDEAELAVKRIFYPYDYVHINIDTPDPNYARARSPRSTRTSRRSRTRRAETPRSQRNVPASTATPLSVEDLRSFRILDGIPLTRHGFRNVRRRHGYGRHGLESADQTERIGSRPPPFLHARSISGIYA